MYASARENGPAMSIQSKLSTCAAARCVRIIRHICAFPSGANLQIYAASIGMNNEIIARGAPSNMLVVQERFPNVASAGIRTSATGIQVYLFTLPVFDFCRSAELVIAASVADLYATKNCRAHHNQTFLGLIRLDPSCLARRLPLPPKNSLPSLP